MKRILVSLIAAFLLTGCSGHFLGNISFASFEKGIMSLARQDYTVKEADSEEIVKNTQPANVVVLPKIRIESKDVTDSSSETTISFNGSKKYEKNNKSNAVSSGYYDQRAEEMIASGNYVGWGCEAVAGAYLGYDGNAVLQAKGNEVSSPSHGDLIAYFDASGNYKHTAVYLGEGMALHGNYTANAEPRIASAYIYSSQRYFRLGGDTPYTNFINSISSANAASAGWLTGYVVSDEISYTPTSYSDQEGAVTWYFTISEDGQIIVYSDGGQSNNGSSNNVSISSDAPQEEKEESITTSADPVVQIPETLPDPTPEPDPEPHNEPSETYTSETEESTSSEPAFEEIVDTQTTEETDSEAGD